MKKPPERPRVGWVINKAREFLVECGVSALPVDPFAIAQLHRWGPISLDSICNQLGPDFRNFLNGRDADAVWCEGELRIIYDDRMRNTGRIRWTIMHEIGHIVLGHLDLPETSVWGPGLADDLYKILEREADTFAAEALAPGQILSAIDAINADTIARVCHLSREAAINRAVDIEKRNCYTRTSIASGPLLANFADFTAPVSVCGNGLFTRIGEAIGPHLKKAGKRVIGLAPKQHIRIATDENGRFLVCPRCGNSEFHEKAEYCWLCGLRLFNECTNRWTGQEDPCGEINRGEARYCEFCGSETYLLKKGLLVGWQDIADSDESVASLMAAINVRKPASIRHVI